MNQNKRIPFMIETETDKDNITRIPNFKGKRKIAGYKLVNVYFVDSSGFGQPDEPALTFGAFCEKIKLNHAYAILEAGQFQVYIGEYIKKCKEDK